MNFGKSLLGALLVALVGIGAAAYYDSRIIDICQNQMAKVESICSGCQVDLSDLPSTDELSSEAEAYSDNLAAIEADN